MQKYRGGFRTPTARSSSTFLLFSSLIESRPQSGNGSAGGAARRRPEWLDSREAAEYLGLHRDTLRKLAAERAIPAEQEGPGCKLFFRRSALDEWRISGGRSVHLASTLAEAA